MWQHYVDDQTRLYYLARVAEADALLEREVIEDPDARSSDEELTPSTTASSVGSDDFLSGIEDDEPFLSAYEEEDDWVELARWRGRWSNEVLVRYLRDEEETEGLGTLEVFFCAWKAVAQEVD